MSNRIFRGAAARLEIFCVEPCEGIAAADRAGPDVLHHEVTHGFVIAGDEKRSHTAVRRQMGREIRHVFFDLVAVLGLRRLADVLADGPAPIRRNRRQMEMTGSAYGLSCSARDTCLRS